MNMKQWINNHPFHRKLVIKSTEHFRTAADNTEIFKLNLAVPIPRIIGSTQGREMTNVKELFIVGQLCDQITFVTKKRGLLHCKTSLKCDISSPSRDNLKAWLVKDLFRDLGKLRIR